MPDLVQAIAALFADFADIQAFSCGNVVGIFWVVCEEAASAAFGCDATTFFGAHLCALHCAFMNDLRIFIGLIRLHMHFCSQF